MARASAEALSVNCAVVCIEVNIRVAMTLRVPLTGITITSSPAAGTTGAAAGCALAVAGTEAIRSLEVMRPPAPVPCGGATKSPFAGNGRGWAHHFQRPDRLCARDGQGAASRCPGCACCGGGRDRDPGQGNAQGHRYPYVDLDADH